MADNKNINKNIEDIGVFDRLSKRILYALNSSLRERDILNNKDARFQTIINRELEIAKGVSNGAIVDFASNMAVKSGHRKGSNNKTESVLDSDELFTHNAGDIFNYFQDNYKNRHLEMADFKLISKFIPALGEAVKTTIDSIVSSDDVATTVTRNLILPSSLSDTDREAIINEIEKIEMDEKLPKKIKNVIIKKTLVTGSFYVYAISYKDLFGKYESMKTNGRLKGRKNDPDRTKNPKNSGKDQGFVMNNATEAYDTIPIATESLLSPVLEMFDPKELEGTNLETFKKNFNANISTFEIVISDTLIMDDVLESLESLQSYKETFREMSFSEVNTTDATLSDSNVNNFDKVYLNGTYIKYIDARNIVPVKIFNEVVGYYRIHVNHKKTKRRMNTTGLAGATTSLFNSVNLTEKRKDEIIDGIIDSISQGILTSFSEKFVMDNSEYRKMIADCIIANGIVDNEYKIQFIPVEHMIDFVINEDENGTGESMLADSLFSAKLLLSLIVSKMLTYMNKSGNKTIAHIFKGPIGNDSSNQLQRVIRMLQESNITFNDLLSTNLVFSKFSRDGNIQLPTARNGDRLVQFETQEGQSVDLNTEFEKMLEEMAILGTGVPSVIMDYVTSLDFAKQITSANIKYAGRIASYQTEFEESLTKLYRILIANSSLDSRLKSACVNNFKYELPRPKWLKNINNSEYFRTIQDNAKFIVDNTIIEDDENPNLAKERSYLTKAIVRKETPFLDWDEYDELYKKVKVFDIAKNEKLESTSEDSIPEDSDDVDDF